MVRKVSPSLTVHNNDIEGVLITYEPYIRGMAQKAIPRHSAKYLNGSGNSYLDVDEVTQRSRIKLWQALRRNTVITSPITYIKVIVCNECVDLLRQSKTFLPLSIDEDSELAYENIGTAKDEEWGDPEYIVVQKERVAERLEKLIDFVQRVLPDRQRQAILCSLKERIDDVGEFERVLADHEMDLEQVQWPEEKKERRSLQASGTYARRALARHMNIDISAYNRHSALAHPR